MIFLNPSVLLGLAAASIPILIHLLNLRKLKKIEFSSIRFLKELQKTKIRKIKFKQWLLLALRVLLILLLVAAFARPTIESVSIAGAGSAAKTTAVLIIDDSYSMSVVSENGSYFSSAKSEAIKLLNDFQQGDKLDLIYTSEPQKAIEFNNKTQIERNLNTAEISNKPGNIYSALSTAYGLIEKSQNFNNEIYLFTDLQKNNFDVNEIKHPVLDEDNAKIYIINLADKNLINNSVHDLKINNQIFQPGKNITTSVSVTNYSKSQTTPIVSLFVNNKRSAQKQLTLNENQTVSTDFEITLKDTGLLSIFAEIDDDDILTDNRVYSAVYIPPVIKVLIVEDRKDDGLFVITALTAIENGNNFSVKTINSLELNSLNLSDYETIFIIGGEKLQGFEKLNEFIKNGGGVVLFPSAECGITDFRKIARGLSIAVPEIIVDAGKDNLFEFSSVEYNHPLFNEIFSDKKDLKIDSPEIFKFVKYSSVNGGTGIIKLQDGSPFLSEYINESGKILVFSVAPNLAWSTFPIKSIFAPMIFKSVYYLGGGIQSREYYKMGNVLQFKLKSAGTVNYEIIDPANMKTVIPVDSIKSGRTIKYYNSNRTGIYSLIENGRIADFKVVNYDSEESIIDKADEEWVNEFLTENNFNGKVFFLDKNDDIKELIYQARFGSELWKVFLILALIVAAIEMLVAKSSKKDIAEIGG